MIYRTHLTSLLYCIAHWLGEGLMLSVISAIAVLNKVRYTLCPMPYIPEHLMLLRKAISLSPNLFNCHSNSGKKVLSEHTT